MIGIIYKITCELTKEAYYGSTTTSLNLRKNNHKMGTSTSKQIIDRGKWNIAAIETVTYEDKKELLMRERHYIENNECINKNLPIITAEEKKAHQQECIGKWYVEHRREHIKACGEYTQNHLEQHKISMKKYYNNNRDKMLEYQRQYRQKQFDENMKKKEEAINEQNWVIKDLSLETIN